jgi:hypothetical protein
MTAAEELHISPDERPLSVASSCLPFRRWTRGFKALGDSTQRSGMACTTSSSLIASSDAGASTLHRQRFCTARLLSSCCKASSWGTGACRRSDLLLGLLPVRLSGLLLHRLLSRLLCLLLLRLLVLRLPLHALVIAWACFATCARSVWLSPAAQSLSAVAPSLMYSTSLSVL